MTDKHSPLPYEVVGQYSNLIKGGDGKLLFSPGGDTGSTFSPEPYSGQPMSPGDAAFITAACNEYYQDKQRIEELVSHIQKRANQWRARERSLYDNNIIADELEALIMRPSKALKSTADLTQKGDTHGND